MAGIGKYKGTGSFKMPGFPKIGGDMKVCPDCDGKTKDCTCKKEEKKEKASLINPPKTDGRGGEGFMHPLYRNPQGTGPRVKRKGYHGYK